MPQIDTVAYIPIIFWTLICILSGYLILNLYFLLQSSFYNKISRYYKQARVIAYWNKWNVEEDVDYSYWIAYSIILANTSTLDALIQNKPTTNKPILTSTSNKKKSTSTSKRKSREK